MAGILAIWNDVAPEAHEHFERWYKHEHLQERLSVPGFRFGRRYEAVSAADRRFFTFYEVDDAQVLSSPAYLSRLENPTPWTRDAVRSFRRMLRTVCDLRAVSGDLAGAYAVVLRADRAMAPSPAASTLVAELAGDPGVGRVQLWTASVQQTPAGTAETRIIGNSEPIAGALIVECLRRTDAERVATALAGNPPAALGMSGESMIGIYGLLCIHSKDMA